MEFEMEFFHVKANKIIEILKKRHPKSIPEEVSLPFNYSTSFKVDYDYAPSLSGVLIEHRLHVELMHRDPYLVLKFRISMKPMTVAYLAILASLLAISHFVLGHWLWVFAFSAVLLAQYILHYIWLTGQVDSYTEKLRQEILAS
jgi:hypothetical protein